MAVLFLNTSLVAQPKPADPPRASALKTPDGAIVFIARNADDPDPAVEKVVLSAAEWKALQDQVEQAKKLATAKPVAPSSCAVRVRVETRGEKPVAVVTVTFAVRTVAPRAVVTLGLQRAQVTAARGEAGKLPVLNPPTDDGLSVLFEAAGEHSLTLEAEAAISPRGKGEVGFDIGLPRAAITTLVIEAPPATATKKFTVGTRTDGKASEPKRAATGTDQLARPVALGATDTLELAWEPPTAAAPAVATSDADVSVRIDDSQIETTAKLRLRGPLKEWQLVVPAGADVTVSSDNAVAPTVVRPTDPNRPVWIVRGPADPTADWLVTATVRQLRPKPTDPKFRGPYPLGPFTALGAVRQSGKLTFVAPPTARLAFKAPPDFRRQDVPDDGTTAAFQFNAVPPVPPNGKPLPWMDLDARLVPVAARVKPAHALTLRSDGWHWEATVKVTPPRGGEVEQLLLDLPAGWETLTAKPEDVVDEVQAIGDGGPVRSRAIRFVAPQKAPFELTLSSRFPVPVAVGVAGKVVLPLPRFPQADERDGTVTATVPDEFELRGLIGTEPLKPPPGRRPPVVSASGDVDRAADPVELIWQPHRPDQSCDARAEITVADQQTVVSQVLRFKTAGDGKPIRLRGPAAAVGLKAVPAVEPVAPGEWEVRPPADGEFVLTLGFALRHPPRKSGGTSGDLAVGLFAPAQFTRHDTVARVWLVANGRRLESVAGNWRELPPDPDPARDVLPNFTLAATGAPPLVILWADATDTGPAVVADRALILATLSDDGTAAVRGRFVLRRWPAGGVELELPADAIAAVFIDGKKVEPQRGPANDQPDERTVRLVLPELKPGRQTALLDVRYTVPTATAGGRVLIPPMPRSAAYRTPVRWHVVAPGGAVPLFPGAAWQPETRWGWRGFGFAPTAASSVAELEQWLTAGAEADAGEADSWAVPAGGETVAARQPQPERVAVVLVPRVGWVAGVSALAFVAGLLVSRLRARWSGPAVAGVGVLLAAGVAVAPQVVAQGIAATQPGGAALALVLASAAGWRWYARRRIDRLPAFTRSRGSAPAVAVVPATGSAVPPASGASRSNRGQSAEVNLEPDGGSAR